MERTKRIDNQTLIAVILSLLLVASLLLTVTGAWFKSTLDEIDGETADFGTIVLGEDAADLALNMTETDVLMPGDDIDVDFNVVNSGTADMLVRFKLIFETDDAEYVTGTTGATITANDGELDEVVYYRHDFGDDGFWYVRADASIGSITPALNETDVIDETFLVPSATGNSAQGTDVTISLYIQAIQAANNGNINDPENAGYDVTWQEYTGPVESGLSLLAITSSEPTNDDTNYTITNVSELGYIAEQTNLTNAWSTGKVFTVTSDIDLTGYEWVPIGLDDNGFSGTFDGGSNLISNMTITQVYEEVGLFANFLDGASVSNLNVSGDINITLEDGVERCVVASIIPVLSMYSTISNCNSDVNITIDGDVTPGVDSSLNVGGIAVGVMMGTITNCSNTGDIIVTSSLERTVIGGIANVTLGGTISSSFNSGNITFTSTSAEVDNEVVLGGLVGLSINTALTQVYNTGIILNTINSTNTIKEYYVGGLIGQGNSGTILNSYNLGDVTTNTIACDSYNNDGLDIGGLIGNSTSGITSCYNAGDITLSSDDIIDINDICIGGLCGLAPVGDEESSYNSGNLVVALNDISNSILSVGGIAGSVMDGNIYINNGSNLGAINISITMYSNRDVYVGGIVGNGDETEIVMDSSFNTGNIVVDNLKPYIGGLIANGDCLNITNCYNTGDLSYEGDYITKMGGLIAYMISENVEYCYSTGAVSSTAIDPYSLADIGSLIGNNGGDVSNCYYDNEISDLGTNGIDVNNGTITTVSGVTTLQMQTEATYVGWDFTTIWEIDPLVNNGYPTLR